MFQAEPPLPPSVAQAAALSSPASTTTLPGFLTSLRNIVGSPGYLLLLGAYGISTGVCFAASTVLNLLILSVFPVRAALVYTVPAVAVVLLTLGCLALSCLTDLELPY